jgi:hypothetical protein
MYDEDKDARKGDVLKREIMVYKKAYAGDILIVKEALRRFCEHYQIYSLLTEARNQRTL